LAAVEIVLPPHPLRIVGHGRTALLFELRNRRLFRRNLLDGLAFIGHLLFGREGGLAGEVWIGEKARGRTRVIQYVEIILAVVIAHASSAADDRTDDAREDDVFAGGISGAAAMALIDDNQIEEVFRIFLVKPGPVLVLGDGLIDREI
jgi:hypothetical protein